MEKRVGEEVGGGGGVEVVLWKLCERAEKRVLVRGEGEWRNG